MKPRFNLPTHFTLFSLLIALVAGVGCPQSDSFTTIGGEVRTLGADQTVTLMNTLTLANGDTETEMRTVNGSGRFSFKAPLGGGDYSVSVPSDGQPESQFCTVDPNTNSGTIAAKESVTDIVVNCGDLFLAFDVRGLSSSGPLTLSNTAGTATVIITANGDSAAMNITADGADYDLTATTQPRGEFCTLIGGTATHPGSSADRPRVEVSCGIANKLYVANRNREGPEGAATDPGDVTGFSINPLNGELTPIGNGSAAAVAVEVGLEPRGLAVDPSGRFVYVANSRPGEPFGTVSQLTISDPVTGEIGSAPAAADIQTGQDPRWVTVDPSGRFVYVANFGTGSGAGAGISAFTIDQATGELTPIAGQPFASGRGAEGFAVHPSGRFGYSSNFVDGTASVYDIDAESGALTPTPGGTITVGGIGEGRRPTSIAVDPTGRFALLTILGTRAVESYPIDQETGLLGTASSTPVGNQPRWTAFDPYGRFAYVADEGANALFAYEIDGTTGALTPTPNSRNPTPVPKARSVVTNATGRFVYVQSATDDSMVYKGVIDPTSGDMGALIGIDSGPDADHPEPLSAAPPRRFGYVVEQGADQLSIFRIDSITGDLVPIDALENPVAAVGDKPSFATIDPGGRFLYVPTRDDKSISIFAIDPLTGELTQVGDPLDTNLVRPEALQFSPNGKFAYVNFAGSNVIAGFRVNEVDGTLTALGESAQGNGVSNAKPLAFSVDGRFIYAPSFLQGTAFDIWTFEVDLNNGDLDFLGTTNVANMAAALQAVAVEPSGRYVYAADFAGDAVVHFDIQPDGTLLESAGSPTPVPVSRQKPFAITIDREGRFMYVVNRGAEGATGDGSITIFRISPLDGTLSLEGDVSVGDDPRSLTIDPMGRFAYVASESAGEITKFSINRTNGVLESPTTISSFNKPYSISIR